MMSHQSPLLKKRALDALLDSMAEGLGRDNYDDLGAHRRGEGMPEQKGTEFEQGEVGGHGFAEAPVVIPSSDLAQAPDPTSAEFFKESDPEMLPVSTEMKEHEFFKEAPEFEMSASGVRRVTAKGTSPEWDAIQDALLRRGFNWLGRVSDGTEMWGRKGSFFVYNPANKTWEVRIGGNTVLGGDLTDLESKIDSHDSTPPMEKEADVPTKSYGMGTPIGGTDNPDAGAGDDPLEAGDVNNQMLDLTASLDRMPLKYALKRIASITDTGWWYKSARPTEQKIQLLQKQLNLTPEQIELCIAADPSPQQKDFVATIAKWFAKKQINLPDDTANIKAQLELFQKLKRSPKFKGNKDVQGYTPETLKQTLDANQESVSKKEEERQEVIKGANIIVQDGDLKIYQVTSVKALNQLSSGTSWCTAHANHASFYLKKGPSYVFFKNNSAFAQLHPSSDQLMNRADVCMVEEIEDDGKTIAKFISDPTAHRGLKLLAQKAPDVANWVKENATDPETLVDILGQKREEEAERGTESRSMAIQWALAKGQPLNSEEEELLPKRVPLNLLMRYGIKFHAGAPWKPLENAILTSKERENDITDYALEFLKGRWPQGEKKLFNKAFGESKGVEQWQKKAAMMRLLDYAVRVVKQRWPELEAKFHTAAPTTNNGYGSAQYAINVLKQRWSEVPGIQPREGGEWNEEVIIRSSPKDYNEYARKFFASELWDKFTKVNDRGQYKYMNLGLNIDDFRPDEDLWIVREWRTLKDCIRSIGQGYADQALDYALESQNEPDEVDIPADWEMIEEVVGKLSYSAMKRIGQSLKDEQPQAIERWAQQHGMQEVDFTNPNTLSDVLTMMARYAPEVSVLENMREAYRKSAQTNYKDQAVSDLSYEITDGMYERMGDSGDHYTELRFGNEFGNWDHSWTQGPVYEVIDRDAAVRLLDDDFEKDISDGQLELYLYEPDMSDRGDDSDEEAWELMERWYTKGTPQYQDPNQMTLQFQSSLLKKKALVEMHNAPTMLPPRDDIKRHLDEQEQDLVMRGVMDGVNPNVAPQRKQKQVDPRINPTGVDPMGIAASKVAWDDDEAAAEHFLEQVQDAKNEAKRHFMQEDYIMQLADDYIPPKTMEQMWKIMGDEYTAEFYGTPYKRVPDFTDTEDGAWEGHRITNDSTGNAGRFASQACPLCKTASLAPLDDEAKGYKSSTILAECQSCRGFYSISQQ